MALADDLNTARGYAEKELDGLLGGHTDQNIVDLINSSPALGQVDISIIRLLIIQFLDRIYDLENP